VTRAAVALGSNLGDRLGHLRSAVDGLGQLGTVVSVSSLYETEPVGGPDQGRYLNAVAVVDTTLDPSALLAGLLSIEKAAGRVRDERWGPRTLDLDLITYGSEVVSEPGLQVPHPRAAERRFVLEPLAEVAPNVELAPGTSAATALAAQPRGGILRWDGRWTDTQPRLGGRGAALVVTQFVLFVILVLVALGTARLPIPPWRARVGLAAAVVGGWLVVGGALALGISLSALPDPRPGSELVAKGPFRFVRHPIYGGLLVGGVGVGVTLGTWWALLPLAALGTLLWFKSGLEERALGLTYPDYPDYAGRVRRRFVPFLF
jgi:2-amino-4-hydroxy-6-hydroxymethyldihydropteridine diphosphokinase